MDQRFTQLIKTPLKIEEQDNQTGNFKGERSGSQFQKNYPKNIFIPIIEYLADIGLQSNYEKSVGTREEFEGKNVVSLSLIHQLISQAWFEKHVNKKLLEANISIKILMNSKIKKKLFHLKVARILLQTSTTDPKEFKKIVSKKANAVAQEIQENDELFDHPSSVIYLLTVFLDVLKSLSSGKSETLRNLNDVTYSEKSVEGKMEQHNSKEEFKNLTKGIIVLLSKTKGNSSTFNLLQMQIRQIILQRATEVSKKYDLINGVPNWQEFIDTVVSRCIKCKIQGIKMTNSLLNQWILEFKQKSSQYGIHKSVEEKTESFMVVKEFSPIILVMPPSDDEI